VRSDFVLEVAYLGQEGGISSSSDLLGELAISGVRLAKATICLTRADHTGQATCTFTNRLGQYFLSVPAGMYDLVVKDQHGVTLHQERLDLSHTGEYRDRVVLKGR
jgi:hypothetical protein